MASRINIKTNLYLKSLADIKERYCEDVHKSPDLLAAFIKTCVRCPNFSLATERCMAYGNCSQDWPTIILYGRCPILKHVEEKACQNSAQDGLVTQ